MKPHTLCFPTRLHHDAAKTVQDYFSQFENTDTILVVNSLARGQGVATSDLDMAILVQPGTNEPAMNKMEGNWLEYSATNAVIQKYRAMHPFAHLHLDIFNGEFEAGLIEPAEPLNYFEVEVGNRICYASPMTKRGPHLDRLKQQWLPYYSDELRAERFSASVIACKYSLNYIPSLITRGLHFHAIEILFKALEQFLQSLFISKRFYPIAYNKWIKEQVVNMLGMPELYQKLPPILSVTNIESDEAVQKADLLFVLLDELESNFQ